MRLKEEIEEAFTAPSYKVLVQDLVDGFGPVGTSVPGQEAGGSCLPVPCQTPVSKVQWEAVRTPAWQQPQ